MFSRCAAYVRRVENENERKGALTWEGRVVGQALTVLDYCLHAGSENVVIYFKDNLYIIKWVQCTMIRTTDNGRVH